MTTNLERISVILPVYNGERFVAEAIHSILAQTYQPIEIIVIDDGSTDSTKTVVKSIDSPIIQYHYQPNSGTSIARNHGVKRSTGEWLAFLDADDLWTPHKLQKQVTVFRENPMVDLVWGHVVEFSDANSELKTAGIAIPGHHPGTMLIRRSAFIEVGEFSEKYLLAEVVEWMARAKQIGINQVMLSDIFMYRRIHQTNKGKLMGNSKYEYLHILKKHRDHERTNK